MYKYILQFLIFIIFLTNMIIAQQDTVFTKSGEIYVGKIIETDYLKTELVTKGNVKVTIYDNDRERISYNSWRREKEVVNTTEKFRNPDGDYFSVHISPFFFDGKENTSYSDNYYGSGNSETVYKTTFNYAIELKIPVQRFTLSPFYSSNIKEVKEGNFSYKFDGSVYGCRISYYFE